MLTTTQRVIFGGALLLAAAAAEAQQAPVIPPIGGGIRLINAQPIGKFRNYVQDGWGVVREFRRFPAKQEVFSRRADAGFLIYR